MTKTSLLSFTIIALFSLGSSLVRNSDRAIAPVDQTQVIVKATTLFLNSLNAEQRVKISFPFTPQKAAVSATFARSGNAGGQPAGGGNQGNRPPGNGNRPAGGPPGGGGGGRGGQFAGFIGEQYGQAVWSNYPVSDVPRPGLQLGSLTAVQREAAMKMLQQLLSAKGYEKVLQIMGSDQALADGGTNYASGKDVYTLGIFGTPNTKTPWMVEFGGHHLGLNVIIAGSQGALTPTLTGAQPSVYQSNGKTVRVLAAENDKAFDLLNALDDEQRKKAILNYNIGDLVLGPGHDGEVIVPEGLKASGMTTKQKEMLVDLISQWAGIINDVYVQARMKEIRAGINDTYFAWSGPTTHQPGKNGNSYYRIQGPRVIIEFSPQGVGGDPTMHVHTIYRDPLNSYGNAFSK
ncbi:DUF3500 domain-containing protein [Hufsiella ginkgonis]|uniref:DUF3500 domain-containing protein n=1 Tax=Hufsiella ginkgonis TaxID=2695274 RepID=A0A7K1XZ35_9SPHI|nr:DUF3500 domain-containing protein [Hufsiella ginkgonis]MXV15816.1 DUF3500 domain-containing protein [Hufsiella ginkgonis]